MKLELCTASIDAILLAKSLDFDRIELCQNLEQGGLTPSAGMIAFALEHKLNTHVLIRPRAGGFCYSAEELAVIEHDLAVLDVLADLVHIVYGQKGAFGIFTPTSITVVATIILVFPSENRCISKSFSAAFIFP